MNYLICQDWINTSTNHAGIKYLCLYLEKKYPKEFKTIIVTVFKQRQSKNRIVNKIKNIQFKYYQKIQYRKIASELIKKLKRGDCIYLMEYFDTTINQYIVAKKIKGILPDIKIYGMSHLVPSKIDKTFTDKKIKKWDSYVDKIITLGTSLTNYYVKRGVSSCKLITTFHYLDNYYLNSRILTYDKAKLTIIAMGNQMRNIDLLSEIVKCNNDVQFIICQGVSNLSNYFSTPNVKLIPFVTEKELRELMEKSDISLNVMYDTIGSNVIVTSLGMGLAMICSDVGSIRDYCDTTNTLFCKDLEDFNNAINLLKSNRTLLKSLKASSKNTALKYSIENFYLDIKNKIEN